ncbi:WD40 repeat protein [Mucilaginibacter frigoritolerans]|uniref:WD40 repeat protein n=1 Tax=Mucilaginibacter frigoritolerans TaxID=652788 RepID=A0A562UDK0_9SPHI|nr:TolB family protein [Mucilaginibacter frigoritolerans]TWJ03191.1 WD40 repeat protein [Mucilaginibacter frigoritolerans]
MTKLNRKRFINKGANLPFLKPAAMMFLCLLFSASAFTQSKHDTTSYIQTLNIKTGKIDTILVAKGDFEAPNWHPDNYLVVNFRGKIYKLDLATKALTEINTGALNQIMDDHGLSPGGKWIAITSFDTGNAGQKVYKFSISIVPAGGGQPKKITTSQDLSFWHGWSPDGKTIAYCGGDFSNLDVYTIPVEGGTPKRLTDAPGLDDGPDYSPDGKYIYFHSYRSGRMQIWRMHTDGSQQEQMTFDENANWFPHPSPDNKSIAYIAYTTDQKQLHPFGKDVKLRLMDLKTKTVKDITPVFYGGAGTINTPSWSPDSKKVAFVSYSVK